MIKEVFPDAHVTWNRVNYEHRDSKRLQLNVTETTTGTAVGSVVQADMEPGALGPGAADLRKIWSDLGLYMGSPSLQGTPPAFGSPSTCPRGGPLMSGEVR